MNTLQDESATKNGTFLIGGDLLVRRLGAMGLARNDVWGEPLDRDDVLRRVVALTSPALATGSLGDGTQRGAAGKQDRNSPKRPANA